MSGTKNTSKTRFIVNPKSGGGATGRSLPELSRVATASFSDFDVVTTSRAGEAAELAANAVADGVELVVAVGGDGTVNEVVNGLIYEDRARSASTALACLPAGTGSDFARSISMPRDFAEALRGIAFGSTRSVDAYRVEYLHSSGENRVQYGVNIVDVGMGGEVAVRVNAGNKRLGGTIDYLMGTVSALAAYRAIPARVAWTDAAGAEHTWEGRVLAVIAANGLYFGGGMFVGRGGAIDDGLLEVSILPPLSALVIARNFHRLYTGRLGDVAGVVRTQARSVSVTPLAGAPLRLDLDGEQPGVAPMHVRILERVLLLRSRW